MSPEHKPSDTTPVKSPAMSSPRNPEASSTTSVRSSAASSSSNHATPSTTGGPELDTPSSAKKHTFPNRFKNNITLTLDNCPRPAVVGNTYFDDSYKGTGVPNPLDPSNKSANVNVTDPIAFTCLCTEDGYWCSPFKNETLSQRSPIELISPIGWMSISLLLLCTALFVATLIAHRLILLQILVQHGVLPWVRKTFGKAQKEQKPETNEEYGLEMRNPELYGTFSPSKQESPKKKGKGLWTRDINEWRIQVHGKSPEKKENVKWPH